MAVAIHARCLHRSTLQWFFLLVSVPRWSVRGDQSSAINGSGNSSGAKCADTDFGALDGGGFGCTQYNIRNKCGSADTLSFRASEMCCICGGGQIGPVCNAVGANGSAPDEFGNCECRNGASCVDRSLQGQAVGYTGGCPVVSTGEAPFTPVDYDGLLRQNVVGLLLAGNISMHTFSVNCSTCLCTSLESSVHYAHDQFCQSSVPFAQTGLTDSYESWMVHGVMERIYSHIQRPAKAVASLQRMWLLDRQRRGTPLSRASLGDRTSLREYIMNIFSVLQQAESELHGCSMVLPGSGDFLSLQMSGCATPDDLFVVSNVHPDNDEDHSPWAARLRGSDQCQVVTSSYRSCNPRTTWIDYSSFWDVTNFYIDLAGRWKYGHGPANHTLEAWYGSAAASEGQVVVLPVFEGLESGEVYVGYGTALIEDSFGQLEAAVQCSFTARSLSKYFRGLVEPGVRVFLFNVFSDKLLATTHGEQVNSTSFEAAQERLRSSDVDTITGDDIFPQVASPSSIDDPVIRQATRWFRTLTPEQVANVSVVRPLETTIDWPEMGATLGMYAVTSTSNISAMYAHALIYVRVPRCRVGHYMPVTSAHNVSKCEACAVGRHSTLGVVAGDDCDVCPQGQFTSLTGQAYCITCQEGMFQEQAGQTSCIACPSNTTSDLSAKTMLDCACKKGFFNRQGFAGKECAPCPHGATCKGGTVLPKAKKKNWQVVDDVFFRCVSGMTDSPCLGGNMCQKGRDGVACSHCAPGYYRFGRDCYPCKDGEDEGTLPVYWFLLLIVFYGLRRVVNTKYKTLYVFLSFLQVFGLQSSFRLAWTPKIKQVMRVIQIANLQIDLLVPFCTREVHYPWKYLCYLLMPWFFLLVDFVFFTWAYCRDKRTEEVERNILRQLTLDRLDELPLESRVDPPRMSPVRGACHFRDCAQEACQDEPDPGNQLPKPWSLKTSSMPPPVAEVLCMDSRIAPQATDASTGGTATTDERDVAVERDLDMVNDETQASRSQHDLPLEGPARTPMRLTMIHKLDKDIKLDPKRFLSDKEKMQDFGAQMLVNLRLMYLPLCGRTFDMLRCTNAGPGRPQRLSKDPDVVCFEGLHQAFMPVVVLALIVYVIGVPAVYIWILYRGYQRNDLYSKKHLRRWGLLYGRFETHYFFWELAIMMRRISIVSIRIFLNIRLAKYLAPGYIGNYQASLTCAVMAIAMAIHFFTHPFQNPYLDFGDAWYMAATFFSSLIGICFSTARDEEETRAMEFLWLLNLAVVGALTMVLLWIDVEGVHPSAMRIRQRVTKTLGFHAAANKLNQLADRLVQKESRLTMEEVITDIDAERLMNSKIVHGALQAAIAHSMACYAESAGITPDHIEVHITSRPEDGPNSLLISGHVDAPHGISTTKLSELLEGHKHSEVIHAFAHDLGRITGAATNNPSAIDVTVAFGQSATDAPKIDVNGASTDSNMPFTI